MCVLWCHCASHNSPRVHPMLGENHIVHSIRSLWRVQQSHDRLWAANFTRPIRGHARGKAPAPCTQHPLLHRLAATGNRTTQSQSVLEHPGDEEKETDFTTLVTPLCWVATYKDYLLSLKCYKLHTQRSTSGKHAFMGHVWTNKDA